MRGQSPRTCSTEPHQYMEHQPPTSLQFFLSIPNYPEFIISKKKRHTWSNYPSKVIKPLGPPVLHHVPGYSNYQEMLHQAQSKHFKVQENYMRGLSGGHDV